MFVDNDDKYQKKQVKVKSFYRVQEDNCSSGPSILSPSFSSQRRSLPLLQLLFLVFTTTSLNIKFVKRQIIGLCTYHKIQSMVSIYPYFCMVVAIRLRKLLMSCYKHWDASRDTPLRPSKFPRCYPRNPLPQKSARWTHFALCRYREEIKRKVKRRKEGGSKNLDILLI